MVLLTDIVKTFATSFQDNTTSSGDFELSKITPGKAANNHLELPKFGPIHQPETNVSEISETLDFLSTAAQYFSQSAIFEVNNHPNSNHKNRKNRRSFFTQVNECDDMFLLNEIMPSRSHSRASSNVRVLGGGQLGRMLVEAASRLNIGVVILDIPEDAPAKQIQANYPHISGDFKDPEKIKELAKSVDILTIEIEHVNANALEEIKKETNIAIHPSPTSISLIQDKYAQKIHLSKHNVPVVDFIEVPTQNHIYPAAQKFGYPLMLKSKTMAYDGRGNYVVKSENDIDQAISFLGNFKTPLYAERWAPFKKELAVIVVKSINEQLESYPIVETVHKNNICHLVIAPAQVNGAVLDEAKKVAESAIKTLSGAGVYCVEMFLMDEGKIFVNEIAPRPHNSGHYTIEACETSQYENHLRAILNLPLGSTALKVPVSAMVNILGLSSNLEETLRPAALALTIPGATVHLYGKKECRKGRKMGHITIVANCIPELYKRLTPIIRAIDENDAPPSSIQPLVGIIMGSDSDLPVMKDCAVILKLFQVPFEISIVSAHRTPDRMKEYAENAHKKGIKVIVAGAGGAAHLPGMVAAYTPLPVIGVPVKGKVLDGIDSVHSILQMPGGIPVATVAINNSKNAGLLAVRQLGAFIPEFAEKMTVFLKNQGDEVKAKDKRLQEGSHRLYLTELG
ncbi:1318_t:CDS:2 [Ambispora leptoticha]|uniref:Phosphoribosylaminoimidazole carboxylase n=1 Tax=Ambispora leptoticha TaxID=144679 RepID=A0A9N9A3I0_9GLOM|nr:1318_t:CDS:2 [Ambispora leptoticha]